MAIFVGFGSRAGKPDYFQRRKGRGGGVQRRCFFSSSAAWAKGQFLPWSPHVINAVLVPASQINIFPTSIKKALLLANSRPAFLATTQTTDLFPHPTKDGEY